MPTVAHLLVPLLLGAAPCPFDVVTDDLEKPYLTTLLVSHDHRVMLRTLLSVTVDCDGAGVRLSEKAREP